MTKQMAGEDTLTDDEEVVVVEPEVEPEVEPAPRPEPEGIAELKRQLAEALAARVAEANRANAAERESHTAKVDVADTNLRLVEGAIKTVETEAAQLKANWRAAMAAGDLDTAADIQEGMATSAASLLQLRNGLQQLKTTPRPAEPTPRTVDPVEELASRLSPASAQWVRDHPEYASDQRMYRRMIRAHEDAVDNGLVTESPAYFEAIETKLGMRREPEPESPLSAAAVVRPAAAPVNRSSRPGTIRLTPMQKEAAADMGMTVEAYAQGIARAQKEGKMH